MARESKKILVVDDSETSLFLMRAIFEDDPEIEILTENDSMLALQALSEGLPDLLVLDIMMPNINGLQLLEAIKSNKKFDDIPVIIVSANHDSYLIDKALEYESVKDYIRKPIAMEELKRRVKKILNFVDISEY